MHKHFLLFLILCLILSIFTCNAILPDNTAAADKIFMWKVSPGNNPSSYGTAYLLGSPGIDTDSIYPLDKRIQEAYDESRKVIVSLDPSKVTNQQVEASLLDYGFLDKTSLDKVITPDVYKRADALIKKYTNNKKSLAGYTRLKPWVIENLIINLSQNSSKEYLASSMSTYFINKANKDKKGVLRLESVDYQFRLLGTLSYSVQNILLENTIKSLEAKTDTSDDISTAWQNGDSESLTELLMPDFGDNTALSDSYNYMLLDRNKHTAGYMKSFLTVGGKYFVVLDASQLLGNNSVLKLLQDMGFTVEQV